MKKTIQFLSMILLALSVNAEETIHLENNKPILGSWMMYAETAALHKSKKTVKNKWTFNNDGTITIAARDPRAKAVMRSNVTYKIEDGLIRKQFTLGRTKTEDCKVIKLDKKEMILHCKFNYYLFNKI